MSTDNPTSVDDTDLDVDAAELQALHERVEKLEASMATVDTGDDQKKMTIVATQGSFNMACHFPTAAQLPRTSQI